MKLFWRTTFGRWGVRRGVPSMLNVVERFVGVEYGGGRRDFAAFQSNGVDADSEGVSNGEYDKLVRVLGVDCAVRCAPRTGVTGSLGDVPADEEA